MNKLKLAITKWRNDLQLLQDYKETFSTPHGQRVLKDMAKNGYVLDTTFFPANTHETAHREGMRRFVLSIFRKLTKNEEELLAKIRETEQAL